MARALLNMASDENVSEAVRLARDQRRAVACWRSEKSAVEIGIASLKPYEAILDEIAEIDSGSRAQYRRSIGSDETPTALMDNPRELAAAEPDAIVDAEVLGGEPGGAEFRRQNRAQAALRRFDPKRSRPNPEHGADDDLGGWSIRLVVRSGRSARPGPG